MAVYLWLFSDGRVSIVVHRQRFIDDCVSCHWLSALRL
ncbi:MAG: hypothetical protein ACI9SB_000834 [Candidatus Azotimanducaceae bacterium]|jgi:hypothetical protein